MRSTIGKARKIKGYNPFLAMRLEIAKRWGFDSVQEFDRNMRALKADPLWVYAYSQFEDRYYEACARLNWYPNRTRHNPMDPRTI